MSVPDEFLPVNPDVHHKISLEVHAAVQEAGVKMPTTPVKVPRPPNSFILYRQSLHQSTTAENPGLRNTEICKFKPLIPSSINTNTQSFSSCHRLQVEERVS